MDPYRGRLGRLPLPTSQQTSEFVAFVCNAHSWYKHLPLFPPGAPFHFFLDPNAGRHLVVSAEGLRFEDRTPGTGLFHYSMVPTVEYRERYGCWQYATAFAPTFASGRGAFMKLRAGADVNVPFLVEHLGPNVLVYQNSMVAVATAGDWFEVPEQVLQTGMCFLTGLAGEHLELRREFPNSPGDGLESFLELKTEHPDHPDVQRYESFLELATRYASGGGARDNPVRGEIMRWHEQEKSHQHQKIQMTLAKVLELFG